MKKLVIIFLVILAPFILGVSISKIDSNKFDDKAALKVAKDLGKNCFIKESSNLAPLNGCTREDQVSYSLICDDLSNLIVCCGLMKDCSVGGDK